MAAKNIDSTSLRANKSEELTNRRQDGRALSDKLYDNFYCLVGLNCFSRSVYNCCHNNKRGSFLREEEEEEEEAFFTVPNKCPLDELEYELAHESFSTRFLLRPSSKSLATRVFHGTLHHRSCAVNTDNTIVNQTPYCCCTPDRLGRVVTTLEILIGISVRGNKLFFHLC